MSLYVNKEKIDDKLIKEESDRLRPHYQQVFKDQVEEDQEQQLLEWSKENVIERVLLQQHAKSDNREIPSEKIKEAFEDLIEKEGGEEKFYKDNELTKEDDPKIKADLELQMRMERLLAEISAKATEPTEQQTRKFYQENKDQFITSEMVHAAHIVIHVEGETTPEDAKSKIEEIKANLDKDGIFEQIADQYSSCPGNGGDLGFFPRGQMVQEFEDVVFAMKPGEISDIVESQFGYHIIKLYEKSPRRAIPFDKVKDQITNQMQEDEKTKALEDFVDGLKEKATIEEKEKSSSSGRV
jgi:parvulin-like peptidyl-prolyl isomerase